MKRSDASGDNTSWFATVELTLYKRLRTVGFTLLSMCLPNCPDSSNTKPTYSYSLTTRTSGFNSPVFSRIAPEVN